MAWLGSPDKAATESTNSPWYFYWARITAGNTAAPVMTSGRTTTTPIFTGKQTMPEFNQVRIDGDGMVHLGMSVFRRVNTTDRWVIYYQRESLLPT